MKHLRLTTLCALAGTFTPWSGQALDLTPLHTFRDLEGVNIPIVLFTDAGKKIAFQPPFKWTVSGDSGSVSLYPAERPDAVMQIRVRARKPLPEGATEDLAKWCRSQLPPDAAEPALESEAANPFNLGTLASREFTFSYAAQGRRFTTSVAIVEWSERERLAVVVTARTPDFAAMHTAAMGSMFSWNPL